MVNTEILLYFIVDNEKQFVTLLQENKNNKRNLFFTPQPQHDGNINRNDKFSSNLKQKKQ